MPFHVPESNRITSGPLGTTNDDGNNGAFQIRLQGLTSYSDGPIANVIASDGKGWEHVSVSLPHRCPTWEEMQAIKELFWDDEDCVMQFHPPKSAYVSNHPYCLHLWRPIEDPFPVPEAILVGIRGDQSQQIDWGQSSRFETTLENLPLRDKSRTED